MFNEKSYYLFFLLTNNIFRSTGKMKNINGKPSSISRIIGIFMQKIFAQCYGGDGANVDSFDECQ